MVFHSLTCKAVFWISTWQKTCAENLALISLSPCPLLSVGSHWEIPNPCKSLTKLCYTLTCLFLKTAWGSGHHLVCTHSLTWVVLRLPASEQAALGCTLVPLCSGRHEQSIKSRSFNTCSTCRKLVSTPHDTWVCWGRSSLSHVTSWAPKASFCHVVWHWHKTCLLIGDAESASAWSWAALHYMQVLRDEDLSDKSLLSCSRDMLKPLVFSSVHSVLYNFPNSGYLL